MVTAVGAGVPHRVGDLVFGQAAGCLGTAAVSSHHTLVLVPPTVSAEAAATVPTVFLTADACLCAAAALRPGQRMLVHASTGGLGLAAIQMAQALGGVCIGTAGSAAKRSFLRHWSGGTCSALGSRDLEFCEEAVAEWGGVDVVINSLTSPGMVGATLAAQRLGGTFVEVGKRDIWSAARLAQVCEARA